MINSYIRENGKLKKIKFDYKSNSDELPGWIDIYNMTPEEELEVELLLGINIPSLEEMKEIEVSSRLYQRSGAVYMTALILVNSDGPEPEINAVTFVLYKNSLITVRYCEPHSFTNFGILAEKLPQEEIDASYIYTALIDYIIDRMADNLENVGRNIDLLSRQIFKFNSLKQEEKLDLKQMIEKIGQEGDLVSKSGESLITINRMITYAIQSNIFKSSEEVRSRLAVLDKDATALNEHAAFLSNKVNFLLDATLGMINIEQNNIIKIFSVAAVISLPPTLIASIYGMNFHHMPELNWLYGYPAALCLMVLSAIVPYKYFKKKKWL